MLLHHHHQYAASVPFHQLSRFAIRGRTSRSSVAQRNSGIGTRPTSSSPTVEPLCSRKFTAQESSVQNDWTAEVTLRVSPIHLAWGRDSADDSAQTDVWNSLHIVTNPDIRAGRRGSRLDISPLKTVGETLNVPVYTMPEGKAAFRNWLPPPPFASSLDGPSFQNNSHLLVTASFGRILPGSFLRLFPVTQRLNVHPSLLPAYRGPAPIQRMLMAGERETGVCVIEMGEVNRRAGKLVDAGSIWGSERLHVPEEVDFLRMQDILAASGGKLLVRVLRDMLRGRAQSRLQGAATLAIHAPLITASDSAIHFPSQTASMIARLERAIGHQRSLTVTAALPDGRVVAIAGSRVISSELVTPMVCGGMEGTAYYSDKTRSLVVACAKGTWLSVERLQTQDRAMLEAKEWWNGIKGMGWVKEGTFIFQSLSRCHM